MSNRTRMRFVFCVFMSALSLTSCAQETTDSIPARPKDTMDFVVSWTNIGNGVDWCETDAPLRSILGDSKLTILKIDASKVDFELVTASSGGKKPYTVDKWADSLGFSIVFNAGMYDLAKPLTARGLMKNGKHYNQPAVKPEWNTMLALNPHDSTRNDCALFDLQQHSVEDLKKQYDCLLQSLRMLDGNGKPTNWKKRVQSCSMLVIAEDDAHNLYLIFTRSPYTHNTMIGFLQQFPMKLKNAMYLEGGPETSLYVNIGETKIEKVGSYVSQTYETDANDHFWPLPNVIGIRIR